VVPVILIRLSLALLRFAGFVLNCGVFVAVLRRRATGVAHGQADVFHLGLAAKQQSHEH